MSVWTESNSHEGEHTLDSLTEYQEDPMPEFSLYGLKEYRKSKQDDSAIDTASEKTMSHYSSMSDLNDYMFDLESLSFETGKEGPDDEVIVINSDEYQPPRISSPRNYHNFLKLVEIPDPPSWRKGTASGANSYRPESVMSDTMSSITYDEELSRENWMREVEEIHGRLIGRRNEKKQAKKQTWSVESEEPLSDSCEDDAEMNLQDEKVYKRIRKMLELCQFRYPYCMSIASDTEDRSITPLQEESEKEEIEEVKPSKKRVVKNGGVYPESVQKVFDIASGKVRRGFVHPDPYTMNKNGFYGLPLMGAGTPPYFGNANAGFFQSPPFGPMNVGNFRPGLMGRFGPASFPHSYNVPSNFPVPAICRGYPAAAAAAASGLPPLPPPANFTPNLPVTFPQNNISNMPPNFGGGNVRPPPHTLTFRPRFPPNFMGPRPQHGFPKPYESQGKPVGSGFRPPYPTSRTMLQKPATQLLMEVHKSALTYECVKEEGPVHDRSYTMRVTVNGIEFLGKAKSKKRAKWVAAAEALKSVYKIQLQDNNNNNNGNNSNNNSGSATPTQSRSPTGENRNAPPTASTTSSDLKVSLKSYHTDMPPVMLLNLLTSSALEYQCIRQDGPVHERLFTMMVTVQGRDFTGEGWNKRGAKAVAARKALSEVFNVHQ